MSGISNRKIPKDVIAHLIRLGLDVRPDNTGPFCRIRLISTCERTDLSNEGDVLVPSKFFAIAESLVANKKAYAKLEGALASHTTDTSQDSDLPDIKRTTLTFGVAETAN